MALGLVDLSHQHKCSFGSVQFFDFAEVYSSRQPTSFHKKVRSLFETDGDKQKQFCSKWAASIFNPNNKFYLVALVLKAQAFTAPTKFLLLWSILYEVLHAGTLPEP